MARKTALDSETFIRRQMKEIVLKVYLQPKSSKNEIAGAYRDGIKIRVTAPPSEGKANKALIKFLAKELRIPESNIGILKGHHSREKLLRISEITEQEWLNRLKGGLKSEEPHQGEPRVYEDHGTSHND
jgi:uncharacterized protein (TIGR00251 family)